MKKIILCISLFVVLLCSNVYAESLGSIRIYDYDADTRMCIPVAKGGEISKNTLNIYKDDGKLITELIINSACYGKVSQLDIGKYYVVQNTAGDYYKQDVTKYYFEIKEDNLNPILTIYSSMEHGRINLNVFDSSDNACDLIKYNSSLKDLTFNIYRERYTYSYWFVEEFSMDDYCKSKVNVTPGNYLIKPSNVPEGYNIDKNSQYFIDINDGDNITKDLSFTIYKTNLVINQYYQNGGGLENLEDAKFDIYLKDNKLVDTLTIKNGESSITLPYGEYILKESNVDERFNTSDDIIVNVNENSSSTTKINIKNEIKSFKLNLFSDIADFDIIIYDKLNDNYICENNNCLYSSRDLKYEFDNLAYSDYKIEIIPKDESYIVNDLIEISLINDLDINVDKYLELKEEDLNIESEKQEDIFEEVAINDIVDESTDDLTDDMLSIDAEVPSTGIVDKMIIIKIMLIVGYYIYVKKSF